MTVTSSLSSSGDARAGVVREQAIDLDRRIQCGFERCTDSFPNEIGFRVHLIRKHDFQAKQGSAHPQQTAVNQNASYKCSIESCSEKFYATNLLLKHLKAHINSGQTVGCPFRPCDKKYSVLSSFTGHLSRNHRSESVGEPEVPLQNFSTVGHDEFEFEDLSDPSTPNEDSTVPENFADLYLNNLAQFFLKLETKFMVPASTVQYIVSEMTNIDQLGTDIVLKEIRDNLINLGLDNEKVNKIVSQLSNPYPQASSKLAADYLRKKFFHKLPGYVPAKEIILDVGDSGKKRVFHYIPVDSSLKAFLSDKSIASVLLDDLQTKAKLVFQDFYNGSVFQKNQFFKENPDALVIILYQDEFEVVCPIGSAKNKYKILAVYYSLGNLPPHLHSNPKNIQLVALCRKKYFNPDKVFGIIVNDLIKLEKEGVEVSLNVFKKVGVAFIAGDNLGSHSLGGFLENFSRSTYFCRYCLIQRKDFNNIFNQTVNVRDDWEENSEEMENEVADTGDSSDEGEVSLGSESEDNSSGDSETESEDSSDEESVESSLVYLQKSHPKRTEESYNNAVRKLQSGSKKSYEGIKCDPLFNKLEAFHVCSPGLGPCLGHDLNEGVVAHDLALFTKYFVKTKKWFTYSNLKTRIETFQYSSMDLRDKPVAPCEDAKRVVGGAWQVWTLLRLYPLIIGDKIKDVADPAWRAILKLIEIMEMVTAPSIHFTYVAHLQLVIDEYLSLRVSSLPDQKLRPKHHYLTHYPKLITELGNLMKCWTLRFESKHSFFKKIMRVLKNFKNVTYSLAEKHQLYQTLLRQTEDYKNFLPSEKNILNIDLFSFDVQTAIYKENLIGDIYECSSFTYKGNTYKKGNVVVINQEAYNINVSMGRIVLLLVDDNGPYLAVEVRSTEYVASMRYFELKECLKYQCISPDKLLSAEPLHVYTQNSRLCVKLKYGLVSEEMHSS
ncbi:Zinc finger protein 76 [Frankliniella fusca]|uniref:Zinc finger protein 76 n=1 Tax=Frankliniella fusca TaxID=407009 RepID=A0AAE1HYM9_9NEOP|nr:Zinc finger protein 76 [Frankliniella fusca]